MKYLILTVVLVALGWFGFTRYRTPPKVTAETGTAVTAVTPTVKPAPAPTTASPARATNPPAAAPKALPVVQAPAPQPTPPAPNRNLPIKIDLTQALGPDNHYQDTAVGLSVMLPEGWAVRDAIRWGDGYRQNTVFLRPDVSSASPSMYYKPYTPEEAAALVGTGAETLLREQAQKKEASRVVATPDYQNVPDSFSFFDVNGSPAMSYFATFSRGDQVMTEHFIRVLSPRGYVMFFTTGEFENVKRIMPQLKQAASTVKGP